MSTLSTIVLRRLSLSLAAVLAISLLFTPSRSFAQASTTPTYFACQAQASFGILHCVTSWEIIKGAEPNQSSYISTLIGDINTTAVSGTVASYFACTLSTSSEFGITTCGAPYLISQGSPPNPSLYQSQLIGYVYTTAVAGTQATYLACTLQTVIGITSCSGNYEILQGFTPSPSIYQSQFIGYVTP